jgi:uncharacterized protein (TIGR03086 family)
MTPLEQYTRVADGFERVLSGVSDWQAPSPCPDWDAHQVAAHVVDTTHRVMSRLDDRQPPALGPDGAIVPAWESVRTEVEKALVDHADQEVDSFAGKAPFGEVVSGLLCADTLLHTWDLARATGQDDTLDLTAVSKAHAFLQPLGDQMRSPKGFGPEITVPADASPQDRLLAFAGRTP